MNKVFAVLAALFVGALSFLYPIKANAAIAENVSSDTHLSLLTNFSYDSDTEYFISWDVEVNANTKRTYAIKWTKVTDVSNLLSLNDNVLYFDTPLQVNNIYYVTYVGSTFTTPTYTGNANGYDLRWDFTNFTFDWLKADGSSQYSSAHCGSLLSFTTNFDFPSDLDLEFSFSPSMSGSISRSQLINGHNYTTDSLDVTVTNNGLNAQWALFIVPHGESITIPALQWDNSQIWVGNSIYAFVKDEWCYDHFEPVGNLDVDTTSFMPSALHYISTGSTLYYHLNWSSMKLYADTSYDLVCYAALNDRGDSAVSFSNTYQYSEVYRSNFTISDPADFVATNEGDSGYSWDNSVDNSSLLSMKKATQDAFGNFAVNYSGQWRGNTSINSSLNTNQAFGGFFNFIRSVMSFFPNEYLALIFIGLSALVVLGIIKAVSH